MTKMAATVTAETWTNENAVPPMRRADSADGKSWFRRLEDSSEEQNPPKGIFFMTELDDEVTIIKEVNVPFGSLFGPHLNKIWVAIYKLVPIYKLECSSANEKSRLCRWED